MIDFTVVALFAALVMFIVTIHYIRYWRRFSNDHRVFLYVLVLAGLSSVVDAFLRASLSLEPTRFLYTRIGLAITLYLLLPMLGYLWYRFTILLTFKEGKNQEILSKLLYIPLIINAGLALTSYWSGLYFKFDDDLAIQDGPLFTLYFSLPFFYIILGHIRTHFHRKMLYPKFYRVMFFTPLIILIGAWVQSFVTDIPILMPSITIALLMVALFILEDLANIDEATALYLPSEIHSVERMLKIYPDVQATTQLFSIEIDGFQIIEQRYHEKVKKRVLKTVSDTLCSVFEYAAFIARYDQAEFLAIEFYNTIEPSHVLQKLDIEISKLNEKGIFPFNLSLTRSGEVWTDFSSQNLTENINNLRLMNQNQRKKIMVLRPNQNFQAKK